jgi:hypothetical protein
MNADQDAIDEARRAGIDLYSMDTILAQTISERWRNHDAALNLILKLESAKKAQDIGANCAETSDRLAS